MQKRLATRAKAMAKNNVSSSAQGIVLDTLVGFSNVP
jgi:hypothetical protein